MFRRRSPFARIPKNGGKSGFSAPKMWVTRELPTKNSKKAALSNFEKPLEFDIKMWEKSEFPTVSGRVNVGKSAPKRFPTLNVPKKRQKLLFRVSGGIWSMLPKVGKAIFEKNSPNDMK